MARIIYAVAGEGYGHSSRAHLVGQRFLEAGHDVMFVASQKALRYLRSIYGPGVREIFGLSFAYRRGRIDPVETFTRNLFRVARANRLNRRLFQQEYRAFKPDLVITDFEPFSGWWALRHRVPFVSLDNEHLLTVCHLEHRLRHFLPRIAATAVTKSFGIGAASYVVTNFFSAPVRSHRAVLAPPIVRPLVTQLKPSNAGHVVVYWTTGTEEVRLRSVLSKFREQTFHVYGFNKSERAGNCLFKPPSTEGFLADLAAARGVVASAGLSLISECMYWRKKMLLLPLPGQYEQILNAHYFEKLGLGLTARRLNEAVLARFLQKLGEPVSQDERILWPDNERFFETLEQALRRVRTPISISLKAVGSDVPAPALAEVAG